MTLHKTTALEFGLTHACQAPTTPLLANGDAALTDKIAGWKMKMTLNMIGQQVKRVRNRLGWSQARLAARLQRSGWDISRSGVSKIEDRRVYVHDFQVTWLAVILGVSRDDLYPKFDSAKPIQDAILQHIHNPKRSLVPSSASLTHSSYL
jgi:transcriptional regulator with XRE-family HTH domain